MSSESPGSLRSPLPPVCLLRFYFHDATYVLTWINAFTRYVYLPAYGCLILALWRRRRWLAIANAGIIACHLWWLAPDFLPDRRFAAATTTDSSVAAPKSLRIFYANVRNRNHERDALWRKIEEADPDIVVLVEFMGDWRESFRKSPLAASYPHNSGLNQVTVDNFLFSKTPPKSIRHDWFAGRCVETAEFPLGADSLRVVGLHSPRPMGIYGNDYAGYWSRVVPMLLEERRPLVVVGDFNATQYSRVYADLKAGGLRSAHEDRARGYATTWPNGAVPAAPHPHRPRVPIARSRLPRHYRRSRHRLRPQTANPRHRNQPVAGLYKAGLSTLAESSHHSHSVSLV